MRIQPLCSLRCLLFTRLLGVLCVLAGQAGCRVVPANPIEGYALDHGRLHPVVASAGQPYVDGLAPPIEIDADVRVDVARKWGAVGLFSQRDAGATAFYVHGDTLRVMPGVLGVPGVHRGNTLDVGTPAGFATLMHEVFHVYQWLRDRPDAAWWVRLVRSAHAARSMLAAAATGTWHDQPFEVEAIAFERTVRLTVTPAELERMREISE